jgi:hypothetical protein
MFIKKKEFKFRKFSQLSFGKEYSSRLLPNYNPACCFVWVSKVVPHINQTTQVEYMAYQIRRSAGELYGFYRQEIKIEEGPLGI